MSKLIKNISLIFLISFSIVICTIIWRYLIIPYDNPNIVGQYSLNNYHPLNDVIKYFLFIFFPSSLFIFWKIFIEKKNFNQLNNSLNLNANYLSSKDNYVIIFTLITITILFFEFLSIQLPQHLLDIYHSGQRMSSAFKSSIDESLWSGSYIIVGLIYETIGTKLIWSFFDNQTIGSSRFLDLFYIFLLKIFYVLILYEITKSIKIDTSYKIIFIILNLISFQYLIDYNLYTFDSLSFRELLIFISLYFFLNLINKEKNILPNLFILGFLTISGFFWSIDRAIINLFLTIFIIFIFIYNKNFKYSITIIGLSIFSFLFYKFLFGNEFVIFLNDTKKILSEINVIHGLIHPVPFSDDPDSSRATKTILSILISIIITLNLMFKNKLNYSSNFKIAIIIICFLSFSSYLYAIGRSDGGHIKQAFGYPCLLLSIFISYKLIFFLKHYSEIKHFIIYKNIFILLITFYLLIIYNLNFTNTFTFKSRLLDYVKLDDSNFLSKEDQEFVSTAKDIVKNESCIQLFTNDVALYYLLKKPSCSKFYFIWGLGSKNNQNLFISDLHNVNVVIRNGFTDHWDIPLKIKYPIVDNYINNNFKTIVKTSSREIRFR